jgi:hypothetical protein
MPHDHGFATKVTDKLEDLIGLIFLPIVSPRTDDPYRHYNYDH